jgi:hypothetical protein
MMQQLVAAEGAIQCATEVSGFSALPDRQSDAVRRQAREVHRTKLFMIQMLT